MVVTYNAGTNLITVAGYTEGTPCTWTDIYNADVAGGWGIFTRQCTNQFCSDALLQIGDGSTATWFADIQKQIIFNELGGRWQKIILLKNNSNFRLGILVNASKKSTRDGCSLFYKHNSNPKRMIAADSDNYTCKLYSTHIESIGTYRSSAFLGNSINSPVIIYNCLFIRGSVDQCDADIYNLTINGKNSNDPEGANYGWSGIGTVKGTIDKVFMSDLFLGVYFNVISSTIKNVELKDYTKLMTASAMSANHYAINPNFDTWIFAKSWTGGGKIYLQYEFDLTVKKLDKTLFSNRPITIWQRAGDNNFTDGDKFYEGITDANGEIPTQILTWGYFDSPHGNTLQQYYHKILIEGDNNHLNYETEFNPNYRKMEEITLVDVSTIVDGINDLKGTGFIKDTHSMPQCLTATGFSTPNEYDVVLTAIQADLNDTDQYKSLPMKLFPFVV